MTLIGGPRRYLYNTYTRGIARIADFSSDYSSEQMSRQDKYIP